jgi:hypothetical protein
VERAVLAKIIISYRRKDSDVFAGRVRDRIAGRYGEDSAFIDVDDMPLGKDFRVHIQEVMAQADVVLIIIGPKWLGAGKGGQSRIKDDSDPVRIEVETALGNRTPTIPILVGKTNMPKPEQLPESLHDFVFINAAPVDTGRDFHRDLNRVMATIDAILGQSSNVAKTAVAVSPKTNSDPASDVSAGTDTQAATDAASDGSASDPPPIQAIAGVEPQASNEDDDEPGEAAAASQVAAASARSAPQVAGGRRTWMPSATVTIGGLLVVGAALWLFLPRPQTLIPATVTPAPTATHSASGETPKANAPLAFAPQPAPVGPATSATVVDSDLGAKAVSDFYAALNRGDGAAAAAFVVPERRNGNFDPQGMTDFFSKNYQPLQLTEVAPTGQNTYHVVYKFKKSEKSSDCSYSGTIWVTQRGGQHLIQDSNVRHEC